MYMDIIQIKSLVTSSLGGNGWRSWYSMIFAFQPQWNLSFPPHFLQVTHIHPPLPQLLTHLCTSPSHTPYIPSSNPHPKPIIRLPIILQAVFTRLHLCVCGRQMQPTPAFGLAGAHVLLLSSWGFYGSE